MKEKLQQSPGKKLENEYPKVYQVRIEVRAEKIIASFPKKDREALVDKIDALAHDSRPHRYIKLKGSDKRDLYRIRFGNYRIVYTIEDDICVVIVVEIGQRKDVYRM